MKRPGLLFATVWVVWALTRLWVLLLLKLLPWVPYDTQLYEAWADGLRAGSFPVNDLTWQYPDLMAIPLVLPSSLPGTYLMGFVAVALLVDAAIFTMLLVAWRRDSGSRVGLFVWALAGIWVGPTILVRLDLLPTLFAVAALVWSARPALSAALSALGFGLKVWPAVTVLSVSRKGLLRAAAVFAGTIVVAWALTRVIFSGGDSFLGAQASRGLHAEAVPALPYVLSSLVGLPATFSETHGTIEVQGLWAPFLGIASTLLGLMVLGVLAWARWSDRLAEVPPADVVFAALLVLVASGRVFSPQFYVWLAGVGAFALLDHRTLMRIPVALVAGSAIVAQYVYPLRTGWPIEADALWMQVLRVSLVVGAALWALAVMLRTLGRQPMAGSRSTDARKP